MQLENYTSSKEIEIDITFKSIEKFIHGRWLNSENHIRTALYCSHQSNEQPGQFVDTFKRGLHKFKYGGYNMHLHQNIQKFLSTFRSTSKEIKISSQSSRKLIRRKMKSSMNLLPPSTTSFNGPNGGKNQDEQFNIKHRAKQRSL